MTPFQTQLYSAQSKPVIASGGLTNAAPVQAEGGLEGGDPPSAGPYPLPAGQTVSRILHLSLSYLGTQCCDKAPYIHFSCLI